MTKAVCGAFTRAATLIPVLLTSYKFLVSFCLGNVPFPYLITTNSAVELFSSDRQSQRSPIQRFTPQMTAAFRSGPGSRQEPGTPSGLPTWVADTKASEPSPATPMTCALQAAGLEKGRTPIRDAGNPSCGSIHCARMPAPKLLSDYKIVHS